MNIPQNVRPYKPLSMKQILGNPNYNLIIETRYLVKK